jgi:hypothetical protein
MRRRELIAVLGSAAAWPFGASAQELGRTYRIAYLGPSPRSALPQLAFFEALGKLGFVEGKISKSMVEVSRGAPSNSHKPRRSWSRPSPI